jgi:hypothetical protein
MRGNLMRTLFVFALLALAGCYAQAPESTPATEPAPEPTPATATPSPASTRDAAPDPDPLVGTVWIRTDTGAPPGDMRIFLADGTLVVDSCWEVYALRTWHRTAEGLVLVEDIEIPATIVKLTPDELQLSLALRDGSHQETAYRRATVPYVCPEMRK